MKSYPILPIGAVSLKNGKNHMHGTVFAAWPKASFVLVKDAESGTFRGITSAGSLEDLQKEFPVGTSMSFKHDQTGKRIGGYIHDVIDHFPITQQGLVDLANKHRIGGIQMATLK
jgi:hypothetical protein